MRKFIYLVIIILISSACTDGKKEEADKYFHEGEQKIMTKDFSGAEADFSKAIVLDPERYSPYHGRGEVRLFIGKKEEGLQDLAKAMQLMKNNTDLNDPQYKAAYDAIKLKYQSAGGK